MWYACACVSRYSNIKHRSAHRNWKAEVNAHQFRARGNKVNKKIKIIKNERVVKIVGQRN